MIEEMKLKDLLTLASALGSNSNHTAYKVGEQYLIRTVTLYYTGKLKQITPQELVLETAAWIPDTGRFYDCLKEGKFNEVEPFIDDVIIPRSAIVDVTKWKHQLPTNQK